MKPLINYEEPANGGTHLSRTVALPGAETTCLSLLTLELYDRATRRKKCSCLAVVSTTNGARRAIIERNDMKTKTLVLAASAAVVLGSIAATSDANARHARGFYRYYGFAPVCIPRRSHEDPMYAPNAPPPCSYDNPGLPDFQLGSRG